MLLVKTYVAASAIQGIGVFAVEPIAAGTVIWRFNPDFDRHVPVEAYENAPPYLRDLLDRYSYPDPDNPSVLVYEVDNGRFMNHSATPNSDFSDLGGARAIRDIAAGEEITCNYGDFHDSYELLPSPDAAA